MLRHATRRCVAHAGVATHSGAGWVSRAWDGGAVGGGGAGASVGWHTRGLIGWVTGANDEKKRALMIRNAELKQQVSELQAEVAEHQLSAEDVLKEVAKLRGELSAARAKLSGLEATRLGSSSKSALALKETLSAYDATHGELTAVRGVLQHIHALVADSGAVDNSAQFHGGAGGRPSSTLATSPPPPPEHRSSAPAKSAQAATRVSGRHRPINLGPITFQSPEDISEKFSQVLSNAKSGKFISESYSGALIVLGRLGLPNKGAETMGPPLAKFSKKRGSASNKSYPRILVDAAPAPNQHLRCFWVHRTDGKRVPFQLEEAVEGLRNSLA